MDIPDDSLKKLREETRALLKAGDLNRAGSLLGPLHPADTAAVLSGLAPDDLVSAIRSLPEPRAAAVLSELTAPDQLRIIDALPQDMRALLLGDMSDDDIADLLAGLPDDRKASYLALLGPSEKRAVERLLAHGEETAGGIMTTEYVALPGSLTVGEAAARVRDAARAAETIYYLYVVDGDGRLAGVLSFRDLLLAGEGSRVEEVMNRNVVKIEVTADQEDAAHLVSHYDLLALPVVDSQDRLVGIVTHDDIMDVIEDEATRDFYRLAGYSPPLWREPHLGTWAQARRRLWWLLALLVGEMAAGSVISGFGDLLAAITYLAFFIPVMSGGAGNAATQSLAVVVRGLGTRDIERRDIWQVVWRETRIGLALGAVAGAALALFASLLQRSPALGLVTGVALALNITAAAALGGFFPIILDVLGFDPAVASGPLITTLTDTISMVIYFGLAAVVAAGGLLGPAG